MSGRRKSSGVSRRQQAVLESNEQKEKEFLEKRDAASKAAFAKMEPVPVEDSALKPARNEAEFKRLSNQLDTTGLRKRKIGEFGGDISEMMFGFGDSWPPNTDAVRTIDSLVTGFIQDMGARALRVAELRPDKKLDKECFLYLVRKDRKKFQRVHRLLTANDEIKRVKKIDIPAEEHK
jgi:hypothetical protein